MKKKMKKKRKKKTFIPSKLFYTYNYTPCLSQKYIFTDAS